MADRFPLIVNAVSKKIEEIVSGDNLELTGNGIVISGDLGAGKYLYSDGSNVFWNSPGDVYLTQSQTLTNKTLENCSISASLNTLTNIPNSALVNSGISVNGVTIPLGGSVTTPDNNTTYGFSVDDGLQTSEKVFRLSDSGGVNSEVILAVGTPSSIPTGEKAVSLSIGRVGSVVTLSATAEDDDTITTLAAATGGTAQTGAITIAATGSSTVSQDAGTKTITIDSSFVDTITRLRATTGQVFSSGDFTFLDSGASTLTQGVDVNGDPTITVSSTDTITTIKGGSTGIATTGAVEILGGTNVTVSQSGTAVTIDSVNTNTVTRLASGSNSVQAGDFVFTTSGATSITETTNSGVTTFEISSTNTDTGASLTAGSGLTLTGGTEYSIKNSSNLTGNTLIKWDSGNSQLADSLISDDGSAVTIAGDLVVTGTQTILETSVLQVLDNEIELRKGNSLVGSDGGIRLNRTSNISGNVTSFTSLAWFESGGYWRVFDGSVGLRLVTESETQILTNKTLTSPTLTAPSLGAATATSVNGLAITSTASSTFTVASAKVFEVQRDLVLTTNNASSSITANLRSGGNVAYTSDTLATFSSTTATQLRGLIAGTTGTGDLVFATNPIFVTGLRTSSTGFDLLNATVTNIQFGGAASVISIGDTTGTTTINHDLAVTGAVTLGTTLGDTFTVNSTLNSANADILIRGGATDPMRLGRGVGAVNTNTALGVRTLNSVTSGSQNTSIGFETLLTVNAGAANTGVGNRVLRATGVGNKNVGMGSDVMLVNLSGSKNVGIGNNSLETLTAGDANVCLGHYAGYGVLGTGNVLIGPADDENSTNATYQPPNSGGNRQLVIGSGTEYWIKGDANFDVTLNNDVRVNKDLTVVGDLVVEGVTTSVNSNIVEIADKNIELASVVSTTFSAVCVDGTANLTGVTPTSGLIPGMEVTTGQVGITIPANTVILSITGNAIVLSANIAGSGTVTFNGIGPSDLSANGGGLTVKGSTDKTFQWRGTDSGVSYNSWTSSEHMDLASGKKFRIGVTDIASETQIGPTTGTLSLGAGVTSSSLTSVGTLIALTVSGDVSIADKIIHTGDTDTAIRFPDANTFSVETNGNERFRIASGGQVGIGTDNPGSNYKLDIYDETGDASLRIRGDAAGKDANLLMIASTTGESKISFGDAGSNNRGYVLYDHSDDSMSFRTAGGERLRIDSGGRMLLGTTSLISSSGAANFQVASDFGPRINIARSDTTTDAGNLIGAFDFYGNDSNGTYQNCARILAEADLDHDTDDKPTRLTFYTASDGSATPTERLRITSGGEVLPGADATQDLGSASNRWANIYSADLQLSNEGAANEVDGTWGQYTIQEGEDDLFLINRRSGKKYKFNLTEVQ